MRHLYLSTGQHRLPENYPGIFQDDEENKKETNTLGHKRNRDTKLDALKNERMGSSSLHHNSLVSNYKKSKKIDSDNAKIHFRITKTKSLYSQY